MIRVLVVDDDLMVAKVHSGYVSRTPGFTVVGVVHTGADALRAVRELRPDLVLLDNYLPDIDGTAVLRELRASPAADVDVIMITAARDLDTIRAAMHCGALYYLIKPFEYRALYDQLQHYASVRQRLGRIATTAQSTVDQSDVDQVFGTRPPAAPALPKGLTSQTAQLVERVLRECSQDLSATECAEAIQLSRISARRYLEYFVTTGKARVRLRYGSTGRPERRYQWVTR